MAGISPRPARCARPALVVPVFLVALLFVLAGCLGKSDELHDQQESLSEDPAQGETQDPATDANDFFIHIPHIEDEVEETIQELPVQKQKDKAISVSADLCKKDRKGLLNVGIGVGPIGVDACV